MDGRKYKAQTASAVLCYSRLLYFEIWPQFQRFNCKAFLTEALRYMGGAPQRVMIDNTHVVALRGRGKQMEPVPEMAAFGERFGFRFVAHVIGDANRSARVERPFHFIENNFLAGRTFVSWQDLKGRGRDVLFPIPGTEKRNHAEHGRCICNVVLSVVVPFVHDAFDSLLSSSCGWFRVSMLARVLKELGIETRRTCVLAHRSPP